MNIDPLRLFSFFLFVSLLTLADRARSDLISQWDFDGSFEPSVGDWETDEVNGVTFASDRFGNVDGAASFDGLDQQYVEVLEGGGLDDLQEGTISLFVKWVGDQDPACCGSVGNVIARQSNGVFSNHVIGLDSSDPATAFVTWQPYNAGGPVLFGETEVGDGEWHHIVVTFAPGEHILYVDGEIDGESDADDVIRTSFDVSLTIGAWIGDGGGYSTSMIDDVKIFDTVLSQEEVQVLGLPPTDIAVNPSAFTTVANQGDAVGTLTTLVGDEGDTFTYALIAGEGDTDNSKFQIVGDELQIGSHDFNGEDDAAEFSVRVMSTGAPSGDTFEATLTLTVRADSDADDLLDSYELRFAENLATLSGLDDADADGDGLTDLKESELDGLEFPGIDPTKDDTDEDSLKDGEEVAGAGDRPPTNPTLADTDGDTLSDAAETNTGTFVSAADTGSNPTLADSDDDGFGDNEEVERGSDPNDKDSIPAASLIAHWPFDGTLEDIVGDNDGDAVNDAGFGEDRFGAGEGALSTDGLDEQYVEVAGGGGLNNLQEGTISLFVKWTGEQDNACCGGSHGNVIARQSNGLFSNQVLGINSPDPADGSITWQPYNAGGPVITGDTAVGDDQWRHVALTWQSGRHVLYLDGEIDGESETAGSMRDSEDIPLTIGAWIGDGGGYSTAMIDDVKIFDGVLSQAQVQELAAGSAPGEFRVTEITRNSDSKAVALTWDSRAGQTFGVEFSVDLVDWIELDDGVEGQPGSTSFTDTLSGPGSSLGYYRVIQL